MRNFYLLFLLFFTFGNFCVAGDLVFANSSLQVAKQDKEDSQNDSEKEEAEEDDNSADYGDLYDISSGILIQLTDQNSVKDGVNDVESQKIFDAKTSKSATIANDKTKEKDEKESKVFKPFLSGRVVYDIFMNDEYQSTDRRNEFLDTRSRGRIFANYNLSEKLALNSYARFERMSQASEDARRNASANGGGDRSFENEGAFFEELNFSYKDEKNIFIAGKFNLNFGLAWRWNRGIWLADIASNYKQREKLGVSGIYRFGDSKKNGRYEFSYAAFTNDRKNLDNSIITKRDSPSKSQGQAGDSRSLNSYALALDVGFDFSEKEKLAYHFSYLNLAVNKRASALAGLSIRDQNSSVYGMSYRRPIGEKLILDGIVEYVATHNVGGNSAVNEHFITSNLMTKIDSWNITTGYSRQNNTTFARNVSEISCGYEFKKQPIFDHLLIQFGYKNQREHYSTGTETRNSLGALMRFQKNF